MDRVEHVKPNFPADAYAGTASYYLRYRFPYPERLLRDLIRNSSVTGEGRLLDLACGPGRVALALASSFREVWAIDLEPEMIEAARREAERRGAENITWLVGRAEDMKVPSASIELITVGEAFHRLDQEVAALQALRWLKPGCCLASLGSYTILHGREPWHRVVLDIISRWTNGNFPPSAGAAAKRPGGGPDHTERVLREAGFEEVASHKLVEPHTWTIDEILGYLYSTSVCSKAVLAGDADTFEAELRTALLAHDPSGMYRESTQWGFTIGRKPT
jgi:ubiquinone/menaquinone biosynthesis C-methylase UbiE